MGEPLLAATTVMGAVGAVMGPVEVEVALLVVVVESVALVLVSVPFSAQLLP